MQSTTEQSEVFSPSDEERDCTAKKKKKREDFYSNAGFRTLKSYFPVELDYTMKGANLRDEFTC